MFSSSFVKRVLVLAEVIFDRRQIDARKIPVEEIPVHEDAHPLLELGVVLVDDAGFVEVLLLGVVDLAVVLAGGELFDDGLEILLVHRRWALFAWAAMHVSMKRSNSSPNHGARASFRMVLDRKRLARSGTRMPSTVLSFRLMCVTSTSQAGELVRRPRSRGCAS